MHGSVTDNLTLLVGAEQSGTTLLRLMLDSHPEIAFAEKFEYAVELIGPDGHFPAPDVLHRHLQQERTFLESGFTIDPALDFAQLINGFLQTRRDRKRAPAVGATMHHDFSKAPTLWPTVKIIHLVRDPRDVAPARMAEGLAGNVWHGLDAWTETEDEWRDLEPRLDPERVLTVHFDNLIRDHEGTLHEICRFIGVDYTAQMLDYAVDTDYQVPSTHVAGDWRDSLSVKDVRLAEARVGPRLVELGFEPSGLVPMSVGNVQAGLLAWQDRVGRAMGRVQSFGLRLTMAQLVVRGLNSEPLQQSLDARLAEVERARRKKSWSESSKYRTSQ